MATYTVTTSNWNDPAFWATISGSGPHTLDFSGLPSSYDIDYDPDFGRVILSDGSTSFTVADDSYAGSGNASIDSSARFTDVTTLTGTEGADYVYGGAADETLSGGGGDDSLMGWDGNESIDGGDGDDLIQGQMGNDTLSGGSGSDTFQMMSSAGADEITGGDGGSDQDALDFVDSVSVTVTYSGTEEGTYVYNGGGSAKGKFSEIEQVLLTDQSDSVDAAADKGGVWVVAGAGDDTVVGGAGNDTVYGDDGADSIAGGAGRDRLLGGAGNDSIDGGDDADTFVIEDRFGNDKIVGGEGVSSGSDSDTIDASAVTSVLKLSLSGAEAGILTDGTDTISFASVENIFTGSGNDRLDAGADTAGLGLFGNAGDDVIDGGSGGDYISGGSGADTLSDGAGNDTVLGGDGGDSLNAGAGDDSLDGGADADTFTLADGFGSDTITGGETRTTGTDQDRIDASALTAGVTIAMTGAEAGTISSGGSTATFSEIEEIALTDHADSFDNSAQSTAADLDGKDGNDTLLGGAGGDTLTGGDGDDFIQGGAGDDVLATGQGQDTLLGGQGNDTLTNSAGDDLLVGGTGDDSLVATLGNDTLLGGAGNDTLEGGADDDHLEGGAGNDNLDGGTGDDLLAGDTLNAPVLLLNFEDGASGTAADDSGNAFDGTYQGGAAAGGTGWTGGDTGVVLDGVNDYVEVADNPAFHLDQGTISIRINPTTMSSGDTFFSRDSNNFDGGGHIRAELSSSGAIRVRIQTDSSSHTFSTASGIITTGDWHHIAVTFGPNGAEIWVDGVLEATDSHTGGITGNNEPWTVGADQMKSGDGVADNLQGFFHGEVDEFAIYDTQLDAQSMAILADGGAQVGGDGNDTLTGGDGADTFHGGAGADSMSGGNDADTFIIEDDFGSDTIVGGEGGTDDDVIDLAGLSGPVTVSYSGNEAGSITDGSDTIDFSEIERLTLTDGNDSVDGSNDSIGLDIDAAGGNDTITGGFGNDSILGGSGNDSIDFGDGDNTVEAGAGDDYVDDAPGNPGYTGNNLIDLGTGNDTIWSGYGNDTIQGGDGDDDIYSQWGDDSVEGGAGNDRIENEWGKATLLGGAGNDTIVGGFEEDSILGGAGNDRLTGAGDDDIFVYAAGDGDDTITDFNTGNSGSLSDGDNDNNDFIDLSAFYDDIWELHADQADDGILNQSNQGVGGVDYGDNTSFAGGSLTFTGASADGTFFTAENTGVVCFTTGTLIETPTGPRLIETLRPGDLVLTRDNGPQPLVWIGQRHVTARALAREPRLRPVVLSPDLLGTPAPLVVSPQHGILTLMDGDETLVRAVHLARMKGGKARLANGKRGVTYVHLMFDRHQIIFGGGVPSESFYPGPQAMAALNQDARAELARLFPDLARARDPHLAFGARARRFAAPRTLPRQLSGLRFLAA